MAFNTGFLHDRVGILNLTEATIDPKTGAKRKGDYQLVKTVWANVAYTKGTKAMREGALDAYETKLIRTRYHEELTRTSRLLIKGKTYQIESVNSSYENNEMQVTAVEIIK